MDSGTSRPGGSGHVPLDVAIAAALKVAAARSERVFLVGGIVRDLMMGKGLGDYDIDLVVEGDGLLFARALQQELCAGLREHPAFLTAKLVPPFGASSGSGPLLGEVDVATARSEEYRAPGSLPTVQAAPIERDLWRRDFSVNALALPLRDYRLLRAHQAKPQDVLRDIIDPTGGLADLEAKSLRVLHPESFIDDPTRLFRAVRYAVRLSFDFDLTTVGAFLNAVRDNCLSTLSPRRIWNEVAAALDEERAAEVIEEFSARGLLLHVPVVSLARIDETVAALRRLAAVRDELEGAAYSAAGKLLLVVQLVRDGREDLVIAVQEGAKALKRARAVLEALDADAAPSGFIELVTAYSLAGSEPLRMSLEAALIGGGD